MLNKVSTIEPEYKMPAASSRAKFPDEVGKVVWLRINSSVVCQVSKTICYQCYKE
jgi:hypothetical protein